MAKIKHIPLDKTLWAKIRFWQAISDISDKELAACLNVGERTLHTYDQNAKNITLERVELFVTRYGIDLSSLLSM